MWPLLQHNRDESILPLNCLFQWPRIHRSSGQSHFQREKLLSFNSTIRKIIILLEIRSKIVMINKGAERAEVHQGCFACPGKDGNLWVDADSYSYHRRLDGGRATGRVGLKYFMMAEMFESIGYWRFYRKSAKANWVISDYLQEFVEDSEGTNIEPACKKQSWWLRNYRLLGLTSICGQMLEEINKQSSAHTEKIITFLKTNK